MADEQVPQPETVGDPPTFEDGLEDLKREEQEKQGVVSPPWKTLPFWLSAAASVIAYTIAALPEASVAVQILAPVAAVLYYLGYNHIKTRLDQKKGQFGAEPYKTKGFWMDAGSTAVSYVLGSGLGQSDPIMGIGAVGALVLGQMGVEVSAWIRRQKMIDPLDTGAVQKKLEESMTEEPK